MLPRADAILIIYSRVKKLRYTLLSTFSLSFLRD